MKKEHRIGVRGVFKYGILGPMIITSAVLPRKNERKAINLSKKTIKQLQEITEQNFTIRYQPRELAGRDMNEVEAEGIVACLNTFPEFWKYEIIIGTDQEKAELMENVRKTMPLNLKKEDVGLKEWKIEDNARPTLLAKNIAEKKWEEEMSDIKRVHGDFGTGLPGDKKAKEFVKNNPNCIHIRKDMKDYIIRREE